MSINLQKIWSVEDLLTCIKFIDNDVNKSSKNFSESFEDLLTFMSIKRQNINKSSNDFQIFQTIFFSSDF